MHINKTDTFAVFNNGKATIGRVVRIENDRRVILKDGVFIAPNVMTEYSRADGQKATQTLIKENVFIGTAATIGSGVTIEKGIVVGSQSYVPKDLTVENGIYVGVPANLKKRR